MSKVRVRMNKAGCIALRNSEEVQDNLLSRAERIKSRAETFGSGTYIADVRAGITRAHAMVKTSDAKSAASNAKHNSLLKSMSAGSDS